MTDMSKDCCITNELPRDCERCATPMVKGHGMVCALTWVANAAFYAGVILLVVFWALLVRQLIASFVLLDNGADVIVWIILTAANAGLLLVLSLACGMRAKWLRHAIVSMDESYLDDDGSCCGGSCAGSCGDSGCSPEGCDDPDCCKKGDACGCGSSCACADLGGCDDGCDSCGDACGCAEPSSMEDAPESCCGGGCCK